MKVIIREAAYADLERIHDWISKDNPTAADSVIGRILDAMERLGFFPRLGREGRTTGTREWVVRGLPYIIAYTVDDLLDEVVVVAVFHGAMNR
jgi:addiction module RelE/StbE family toxin